MNANIYATTGFFVYLIEWRMVPATELSSWTGLHAGVDGCYTRGRVYRAFVQSVDNYRGTSPVSYHSAPDVNQVH